ncbi:MAG: hypothetical protein N3B12_04810 [Armatimonadetes bacterium]|nr:hypothetical protein [Armatimonadota bacterium]
MSESKNALPVRTYVRCRVNTIVQNIAEMSSGSVPLNLDEPSDVTLMVVSDPSEGMPWFFTAAVGRPPTLSDFDIIIAPLGAYNIKPADRATLHLPAMESTLYWASFGVEGTPEPFGEISVSRLVVAIDQ